MPVPTVLATPVPKLNAETKLKKAAQMTACKGVRTRVATTVATELAASWNPLRKSKARATPMMTRTSRSLSGIGMWGRRSFLAVRPAVPGFQEARQQGPLRVRPPVPKHGQREESCKRQSAQRGQKNPGPWERAAHPCRLSFDCYSNVTLALQES